MRSSQDLGSRLSVAPDSDCKSITGADSSASDYQHGPEEKTPSEHHLAYYSQPRWRAAQLSLALHVSLVLLLGAVWLLLAHYRSGRAYGVDLIESPAREAVRYEKLIIDTNIYEQSDFIGEPRHELDEAWAKLLQHQYSAVSPTELVGEESLKLNDVTGRVLVTLEAYNSLNCLDSIRRFAFRAHYNTTATPEKIRRFGQCLERVRQTLMCYADISFSTYVWSKGHPMPFPNFRVAHECRDWSSIEQWAEEHKIPPLGDELLFHPVHGPTAIL